MSEIQKELFQLIRAEKVILWSGAGMSLYAGYPNGKKLGKTIIKSVPTNKKPLFSADWSLDDICERFIQIMRNDRKPLFDILTREFSKKPKSIDLHRKLSLIPHFKTIITTNYDPLFEQGYGHKIQVVTKPTDLLNVQNKRAALFKIHGDLNNKENIIIAKSDYANYFDTLHHNVYWTTVTERIINNHIVFVGYALGDINIDATIKSISRQFNGNQKKHFLVAPGFKAFEVEVLRQKNIHYIDSTAEKFVDELIAVLRENIIQDHNSGLIGIETLSAFLHGHDLSADFIARESTHVISRISSIGRKSLPGTLSITGNPTLAKTIGDIGVGKNFGRFELNASDCQIVASASGVKLFDESDLQSLIFVPRPRIETTFDIDFANGFELRGVPVKLYHSQYKSSTIVEYENKTIKIDIDADNSEDFHLSFEYPRPYGKPKDEAAAFKLLLYLADGCSFTIFIDGKSYSGQLPSNNKMTETLTKYVSYFETLLEIEKFYKVRFGAVDEISERTFYVMSVLRELMDSETISFETEGCLHLSMLDFDVDEFQKSRGKTPDEISVTYTDFAVALYGRTFKFKERTWRLFQPELVDAKQAPDGSVNVTLKSRSGKGSDTYIMCDNPTQ